jgi:hypothetical protein
MMIVAVDPLFLPLVLRGSVLLCCADSGFSVVAQRISYVARTMAEQRESLVASAWGRLVGMCLFRALMLVYLLYRWACEPKESNRCRASRL